MGAGVTLLLSVGEPVALGVPPKNCEKSGAGGNGGFCEKSGIGGKGGISKPGTLDPFATGLMILVIGNECKKSNKYLKMNKVYEANFRLGFTSTTGDPEG